MKSKTIILNQTLRGSIEGVHYLSHRDWALTGNRFNRILNSLKPLGEQ